MKITPDEFADLLTRADFLQFAEALDRKTATQLRDSLNLALAEPGVVVAHPDLDPVKYHTATSEARRTPRQVVFATLVLVARFPTGAASRVSRLLFESGRVRVPGLGLVADGRAEPPLTPDTMLDPGTPIEFEV